MKWFLILLALLIASPANGRVVDFTYPIHKVKMLRDEESGQLGATCETDSSTVLSDIHHLNIYRYPKIKLREKLAVGRQGMADTLHIPDIGNHFITVVRENGVESCASALIYGDLPTTVELPSNSPSKTPVRSFIIDVQGRRTVRLAHYGVYFLITIWSDGSTTSERLNEKTMGPRR